MRIFHTQQLHVLQGDATYSQLVRLARENVADLYLYDNVAALLSDRAQIKWLEMSAGQFSDLIGTTTTH